MFKRIVANLLLGAACAASSGADALDSRDMRRACRVVLHDDAVRALNGALPDSVRGAYRQRFPDVAILPSDSDIAAQARWRCADGRALVCFVGANLPCAKIDARRRNRGADAFCRDNPGAEIVSAAATGHDALFSFACRGARATISGRNWRLDARGFAGELWVALPDR